MLWEDEDDEDSVLKAGIFAEEEFDSLSRTFQNAIGKKVDGARRKVLARIREQPNKQSIWEQVQFFHDSPLALYHGTFDTGFMDYVFENCYPRKVELFGLPSLV